MIVSLLIFSTSAYSIATVVDHYYVPPDEGLCKTSDDLPPGGTGTWVGSSPKTTHITPAGKIPHQVYANGTLTKHTILISGNSQNLVVASSRIIPNNESDTSLDNASETNKNPNGTLSDTNYPSRESGDQNPPRHRAPQVPQVTTCSSGYTRDPWMGLEPNDPNDPSNFIYDCYCIEPSQKASVGTDLSAVGIAPAVISQIIDKSDTNNFQSAYIAQLKIWVIVSGGKLNINEGEVAIMKQAYGISDEQLNQDIKNVKQEVMDEYGVSSDEMYGLLEYENVDSSGSNLLGNLIVGLKHLFGLYESNQPDEEQETPTGNGSGSSSESENQKQNAPNQQKTSTEKSEKTSEAGASTQICPNCNGEGSILELSGYHYATCSNCGGSGRIGPDICTVCGGDGYTSQLVPEFSSVTCSICGGSGVIPK